MKCLSNVSPWHMIDKRQPRWLIIFGDHMYHTTRTSRTYIPVWDAGISDEVVEEKYIVTYSTKEMFFEGGFKQIRIGQYESISKAKKSLVRHWKDTTRRTYERIY